MIVIGAEQSLSNSAMYEHICLENINKLYESSGKYDDQQQYKAIIEAEIIFTTEVFTDNSPMSPSQSVNVKHPRARKSLRKFLDTLGVKPKTAVRRFCAAKSKRKAIRDGSMLWSSIPNKRGYPKSINRSKNILTIEL